MIKTLILIILTGIAYLGCSDNFDNTLVSTSSETDNFNSSKIILSDTENLTDPRLERDPRTARTTGNTDLKKLSVSKSINGITGGDIIIDTSYVNYQGRQIYVYARLKVHSASYQGITNITIVLHPEEATIELFPHMVFATEAELSVTYEGIDLPELGFNESGDVKFVFFNENGEIEIIDDKSAKVDLDKERIKVTGAKLYHFSRYGWIR